MAPNIYVQTCSLNPASINLNSSQQKWKGKAALKEYSGEEKCFGEIITHGNTCTKDTEEWQCERIVMSYLALA